MFDIKYNSFAGFKNFGWFFNLKKFNLFKGIEITLFGLVLSFKEKYFFNKVSTLSFCYDF